MIRTATPTRTCVGCRTPSGTAHLVRVGRRADGTLVVDRTAPGRGAWLCGQPDADVVRGSCLSQAQRRRAFDRAFGAPTAAGAIEALRERHAEREKMESDVASSAT